jgi:hypothetical protein
MKPDLADVIILLGAIVLIYGLARVSLSGAIIVCGLVLIVFGIELARRTHGRRG